MCTKVLISFACFLICLGSSAQAPVSGAATGGAGGGKYKNLKIGHIYGKIFDAKTKETLPYTPVVVLKKDSVVGGCITKDNGEFSIENLPFGKFTVKISALGYDVYTQEVTLTPQNDEMDMGNIKIGINPKVMKEVDISADKSASMMTIDRKVFNVGADLTTRGGTAEDAMKNIPSVTVDASGNAQLRQQAATIYIDGRPTTLTLDQIPADQIDRIEVITNPSAKFEASATGGILNIVMKENNKPGYNGIVTGGVGTNGRYNGTVILNYKQKPFGISLNYNVNSSDNPITGVYTERYTYTDWQKTGEFYTQDNPTYNRTFQRGSLALDYYLNNRNTLTLSEEVVAGNFNTPDNQLFYTKSLIADTVSNSGNRSDPSQAHFRNYATKLHYRKTFPKKGEELTADANFSYNVVGNSAFSLTETYNGDGYTSGSVPLPYTLESPQYQSQSGTSISEIYTEQLDYTNPLNDSTKFEAGFRSNYKPSSQSLNVYDNYNNAVYDGINPITSMPIYTYYYPISQQVLDPYFSSYYSIQDLVNAAYANYTSRYKGWNYALGLRFEDSYYKSTLTNKDSSFTYNYPSGFNNLLNSLFPSVFLTRKLNSSTEFQLNFSRKINRPNFRQLMPFIQASDAKDYSIGNPDLTPEFINMGELNLNKTFEKGNFFFTIFGRNSENTLTTWTEPLVQSPGGANTGILETTTINGTYSNTLGMDNTLKYTIFKGFEATFNMNLFYTKTSATGPLLLSNPPGTYSSKDTTSTNQGFYGIAKILLVERLPGNFAIQLSGSYESPKPIPQGYALPIYFADCGVSKEIKKFITITGSVSDIFNTKIRGTYVSNIFPGTYDFNDLFNENGQSVLNNSALPKNTAAGSGNGYAQFQVQRRETAYVKLTVSIKFGKADATLFKRKKAAQNGEDQDASPF